MGRVTSADGTTIAFSRQGTGEALIVIDGALCHRGFGPTAKLARHLAERFTVYTYDRRGRGESDDAAAGRFESRREIEDVEALLREAGGAASLLGVSSGGALALEAAGALGGDAGVAVYEVPFITAPDDAAPVDFVSRLRELVGADRRSRR